MASKIAHKFTGDGSAHYIGIPARDLTAEEFDALDDQQREAVESGALYKATGARGQAPAATADAETEDEDPIAGAVGATNAQALKEAGFGDAAAIKAASDEDLTAVPGIGKATLDKLRALGD